MQFDFQHAPIEKLEKTRALLNVHRHACHIYRMLGVTTYHDGQPVNQALAQVNGAIGQINVELERRKSRVGDGTGPGRLGPPIDVKEE